MEAGSRRKGPSGTLVCACKRGCTRLTCVVALGCTQKAAEALADPSEYANLFPDLEHALRVCYACMHMSTRLAPLSHPPCT